MTLFRILIFLLAAAFVAAIFWAMGADGRSLGAVLSEMVGEPWTVVTLIDLYLGFVLSAVVIGLYERSALTRVLWITPIFFLGNVWTAVWFIVRLPDMARRFRDGAV